MAASGVAVAAGATATGVAAGWDGVSELTCPPPVDDAGPTGVDVKVGTGVLVESVYHRPEPSGKTNHNKKLRYQRIE